MLVLVSVLSVVVLTFCLDVSGKESTAVRIFVLACSALGLFLLLLLVSRAGRLSAPGQPQRPAGDSARDLERERTRRVEAERKAHRILESESFLVKASLGLISRESTTDVVQHLADEALRLFQVRWAIVGAFPANSRELEIMGAARHDSVKDEARVKQPISGKGIFRRLWEGHLETIVCNDVATHPDRIGYPEGHPDVKKVIIVPLVDPTMEMIGVFILGDRLDGRNFSENDRYLAELLTHYGSAAVARSRAEEDRRKAEQRLQDTTREQVVLMSHASRLAALGEMASVMAHELNQPLGSIRNYLSGSMDELRRKFGSDEPVLSSLEKIPGLVDRAAGIIKRLREFATLDEDTVRAVSIAEVIENAVDLLKPRMERLGIVLTVDIAPDLPTPLCDPLSVEQVILNLLTNACDAMKRNGDRRLTISARAGLNDPGTEGETVEVSVAARGPGVPDAMRAQIFDAFYTSKPHGERLGLGLSISRSLIREYGGDIVFRNRRGRGSVFTFRLPTSRPANGHRAPAKGEAPLSDDIEVHGRSR